MRLCISKLALAAAALAVMAMAVPIAQAQAPVPIEGIVLTADTKQPVVGATIDIYRMDIKGKYETKTDKRGGFTYPLPQFGTFTVIVSGPNLAPQYRTDVRVGSGPRLEFAMVAGNGQRPTLDDVSKAEKGGGAGSPKVEDPKAAEERAKLEEERAKALAEKDKFDTRKGRFDAGVAAMQSKDYPTAVTEFTAALEGLENADPKFYGELATVGGGNLAETHYRMAVEAYNKAQSTPDQKDALKAQAKEHLLAGAKAAELSVKFDQTKQVNYLIQGKILLLLVDKYGATDDGETGAAAYRKAAELETADPKNKIAYLVDEGDVYRAAFMTDKAIDTYKQVLTLDPNNVSAYYGIGLAAMGTSDEAKQKDAFQTAADYLKAFLDKAPSDPRSVEVKATLDTLAKDFKIKPRPIK